MKTCTKNIDGGEWSLLLPIRLPQKASKPHFQVGKAGFLDSSGRITPLVFKHTVTLWVVCLEKVCCDWTLNIFLINQSMQRRLWLQVLGSSTAHVNENVRSFLWLQRKLSELNKQLRVMSLESVSVESEVYKIWKWDKSGAEEFDTRELTRSLPPAPHLSFRLEARGCVSVTNSKCLAKLWAVRLYYDVMWGTRFWQRICGITNIHISDSAASILILLNCPSWFLIEVQW